MSNTLVRNADDVAISRNREELKKELQRERPKKEIVLALCRQTFFARRADVLSEAADVCVSALLSEFPEFWKPYVVINNIVVFIHKCHETCITAFYLSFTYSLSKK